MVENICQRKLYNFKHPPFTPAAGAPVIPAPDCPLEFFDRHLADHLVLKRVVVLPSLLADLAQIKDTYSSNLEALPDECYTFSEDRYRFLRAHNAEFVRDLRGKGVDPPCTKVAAAMLIHPSYPHELPGLIHWGPCPILSKEFATLYNKYVVQETVLKFLDVVRDPSHARLLINSPLDTATRTKVVALVKNVPYPAIGMFFCTDAFTLLEEMDKFHPRKTFDWSYDSTCSKKPKPKAAPRYPPDAPLSLWNLPEKMTSHVPAPTRRSPRDTSSIPDPGDVKPIIRPDSAKEGYKPQCRDYVQRAWINAVRADATGIVFDCGHYIRIGVRHRQSQTLFLSELVDIRGCESPPYGELWNALHIAFVYDAIQRLPLLDEAYAADLSCESQELVSSFVDENHFLTERLLNGKKRCFEETGDIDEEEGDPPTALKAKIADSRSSSSSSPQAKRRRTLPDISLRDEIIAKTRIQLRSCDAILLYFRFGIYESMLPLVLIPDIPPEYRKVTLKPNDYCIVTVNERLGGGASGDVYSATLLRAADLFVPEGGVSFVIKLATVPKRIKRISHEYSMYAQLRACNITGVPFYIGYWTESRNRLGALMLGDAGQPLPWIPNMEERLKEEGHQLISTLKQIHDCEMLHRDIRTWNILVDDYGRWTISDFDRANLFMASDEEYEEEMERLHKLVAGEDVDRMPMIGVDEALSTSSSDSY